MYTYRADRRPRPSFTRRAAALLLSIGMLAGAYSGLALTAAAQRSAKTTAGLSDDQRIVHVLNRLGFGARPGDVERVRKMGLERYIEQQLDPIRIDDAAADTRIKGLESYSMTTAELYEKYPQPGRLVRQLQRQGKLPDDLKELATNRNKADAAPASQENPKAMSGETMDGEQAAENSEAESGYRRALRQYYRENDLRQPARIVAELQASRILRAVYSERQLQEVLVDFWTNHFNVFANKGAGRWLLTEYDRDVIRPNTMGKFKDILLATAQSPAMLFYLDNFRSSTPDAGNQMRNRRGQMMQQGSQQQPQQKRQRGINENYARELLELHTLGVEGGYTQKDVQEVARCFTGWTIFAPRGAAPGGMRGRRMAADVEPGSFYFAPRLHDDGEKTVLGRKIAAGGGIRDGLAVLDILAKHPSTAKFIATKLARRFISDDPSPALVERTAAAYTKSEGDIRTTLRALFASPEFNAPENYRAKIKTPFELAISALRSLGGDTTGAPALHQWIARMGEPLYQYQAPTGYPDTAENWVNTGALLERMNFALALVGNRIVGTRVDLKRAAGETDRSRLIDTFARLILQENVSERTKAVLLKQLNETAIKAVIETPAAVDKPGSDDMMAGTGGRRSLASAQIAGPVTEPQRIAALILGSPEFQRQ